jgi:hypothetical protein
MKVPLENEGGIGRGIKPKRDRKRIYFIEFASDKPTAVN